MTIACAGQVGDDPKKMRFSAVSGRIHAFDLMAITDSSEFGSRYDSIGG
jgi:hypothetical protein